jgi:N-acetylglucosaminyl-diphospho-decaprenol L-rhamnosyltransferase
MTSPRVATIIVTYNSINTIGECLSGLEQCRREGLTDAIVVDNASTDGTADFVAREHPWVKLIRPGKNLGFGRGNNLGFEGVETEYAFFLNPDASIGPEALRLLVDFMDKTPAAGVSAPAAMTPKGTGHMSGSFPAPWHILAGAAAGRLSRKKSKWLEPGDKPFQVHWVPGAALLFRSELFRKLGGFDSRFFLYFEETDLLLRAHQAGYEIWAVCEATIHHDGQGSTKQQAVPMFEHCIAQHYFQSRLYYLAKHHGRATAFVVEGGELAFMALRALPELVLKRRVRLFERLKGPVFELPPKP